MSLNKETIIFKQNKAALNSELIFLLDWLPIQGQRTQSALLFIQSWRQTDWFICSPKALAWNDIPTTLSRIWIHITDSISYDDNRYNTCVSRVGSPRILIFN